MFLGGLSQALRVEIVGAIFLYFLRQEVGFFFIAYIFSALLKQLSYRVVRLSTQLTSLTRFHIGKHSPVLINTRVVYHLHGQTSWFMVWVNGSQTSGLANFVPESPLPFVKISVINRKTTSEGLKLVSKIALKKWNTNFRLEYSIRKNRTTFSDVPLPPEIFRWEDLKSCVPFTFQPDFPGNFCKW